MESAERGRFWTLSNAVSLLRAVLIVPAVWLISLGPDYVWEAFGVVVVMIVSDWIDGWLARWRDEISQWGKILDPLADKVAVGAITIAMVVFKDLPVWLVVVVLLRDMVIFFAGMYLVKRHDVLLSSNFWGQSHNVGAEWVAFGLFVGCPCAQARADWSEYCVSRCFTDQLWSAIF